MYAPTQSQERAQTELMALTGLPRERIQVHTTFAGGTFGRMLEPEALVQAAELSMKAGRPVKLIYSRQGDLGHDFYRPPSGHLLKAAFDADNRLTGVFHRIAASSILDRFPHRIGDQKIDPTSVEGTHDQAYAFPAHKVEFNKVDAGVRLGFWRSVGHSFNAFVLDGFVDEMAHQARIDPLTFRLDLMAESPRWQILLKTAAEMMDWGRPLEPGRGIGLSIHQCFGSISAQAAEVTVSENRELKVHRVTCAIDCGQAVNPGLVEAHVEGGIVFALSAAMFSKITLKKGRVEQGSFSDYPMVKISQAPVVRTAVINSGEKIGGVGEPCVPPLAPAVANAIFAATGERIRSLPLADHGFTLK